MCARHSAATRVIATAQVEALYTLSSTSSFLEFGGSASVAELADQPMVDAASPPERLGACAIPRVQPNKVVCIRTLNPKPLNTQTLNF